VIKARSIFILLLITTTVGCDRVTKHLATTNLAGTDGHSFLGDMIRLEYAENTGAFLSLGTNLPEWARVALFIVGVAAMLGAVAYIAIRQQWSGVLLGGAALLWAGGASNLIDRIMRGSVVDFMNIGVGPLRTGIFNVADVAVMLGAALIMIGHWRTADDR
jgi:signal peptidase II